MFSVPFVSILSVSVFLLGWLIGPVVVLGLVIVFIVGRVIGLKMFIGKGFEDELVFIGTRGLVLGLGLESSLRKGNLE